MKRPIKRPMKRPMPNEEKEGGIKERKIGGVCG